MSPSKTVTDTSTRVVPLMKRATPGRVMLLPELDARPRAVPTSAMPPMTGEASRVARRRNGAVSTRAEA